MARRNSKDELRFRKVEADLQLYPNQWSVRSGGLALHDPLDQRLLDWVLWGLNSEPDGKVIGMRVGARWGWP
ncbi:MAG: hypothetical protein JSS77_08650 [Acidobacteria bacterium]|nr:hypothetical protein [Acidobacteriota bacterium]